MIPGEYVLSDDVIEVNAGRKTVSLVVKNAGDRPIQVGSHFHFFEVNRALVFEREEAFGMRLDIPSSSALRFEPGQDKDVRLVELGGGRSVYGLNALTDGTVDDASVKSTALRRAKEHGFGG